MYFNPTRKVYLYIYTAIKYITVLNIQTGRMNRIQIILNYQHVHLLFKERGKCIFTL